MQKRVFPSISLPFSIAAMLLFVLLGQATGATRSDWTQLGADRNFAAWHQPTGDWYEAGDAMVDSNDRRRLAGKPGTGVLINGKTGRTKSLVTKKTFQDVEVHLESMVAKGSNSGVSFHGNEEEKPHVRHIDPEVGVWHSVKLTMQGRTFSAEFDGEVLLDRFEFHDWMMNMEAAPIRLQKLLDGMALTGEGVFVSTIDGTVACLRTKNKD